MQKIIEIIPNFSEGRDEQTLHALRESAQLIPGTTLLDWSADPAHNRSVFTLIGTPEGIAEAAYRLAETAVRHIDLRHHVGEHPRMGALDVLPFVPLQGATMSDCIALARVVGQRIGTHLDVPIILYENSASAPHRVRLPDVRRGGFSGLSEKLAHSDWRPDFGPAAPHPTAGAIAVGARSALIAFNVNLATGDVSIAKKIAHKIRESSGGLPACRAIGIMLHNRGIAQVSMNMVDFNQSSLYTVFRAIEQEAETYGIAVLESELIGLLPRKALIDTAVEALKLRVFDDKRILEEWL